MSIDPLPFLFWQALGYWAATVGTVLAFALLVSLAVSIATRGGRGVAAVFREFFGGLRDFFATSPRRIWALSTLTSREAVRRKAWQVMLVFAVVFLFAGWFLSKPTADGDLQVKTYVSFVLTAVSWLILPSVFLLACWSLPDDIKARSLHTVVTKPVLRSEVLFGRVAGITLVGTFALLVMGVFGYVWLTRALPTDVREKKLIARVPVYGQISYRDRKGDPAAAGVNTGDIWMFRSYIEGNTKAMAIWDFEGITPQRFLDATHDKVRLESNFQVFRTYKGDIESGILCRYVFVNESGGKKIRAPLPAFPVHEFRENIHFIDRKLFDEQNRPVDLFNDLVDNGKLRVEVQCLTAGQFLGVARPDLFFREPDAPFWLAFFKSVFGIWMMMVLLIVMGVVASCFLKGPVATLLTFTFLIVGRVAQNLLASLTSGEFKGGGALESAYRILTRMNPNVPIEDSTFISIVRAIDMAPSGLLKVMRYLIPSFEHYNLGQYAANGYDVPWNTQLLPGLVTTFGYALPCLVLGYFSLKLRELESK